MSSNTVAGFVALFILAIQMAIAHFNLLDSVEEMESDEERRIHAICKPAETQGKYLTCSAD